MESKQRFLITMAAYVIFVALDLFGMSYDFLHNDSTGGVISVCLLILISIYIAYVIRGYVRESQTISLNETDEKITR
jgi:hypothetical protein